MYIINELVISG